MQNTQQNAVETTMSHTEAAQARIEQIRAMRQVIPYLVAPVTPNEGQRLGPNASVPPELVEIAASARANSPELVHGSAATPEQLRDLMSYAMAYEPLADELDGLSRLIRHSALVARSKAGSEALTTFAFARRLAKRPETANLAQHVTAMRRALRGRFKAAKAQPQTPDPTPAPTPTPQPPASPATPSGTTKTQ